MQPGQSFAFENKMVAAAASERSTQVLLLLDVVLLLERAYFSYRHTPFFQINGCQPPVPVCACGDAASQSQANVLIRIVSTPPSFCQRSQDECAIRERRVWAH